MPNTVRLRQVALVAGELVPVADRLQKELGLGEPFRDPGVGEFGLENAVFAVGDTFIEVVAPIRPDTTAGRLLAKRGGDGGYMAIFQVPELSDARRRVGELGVRIVWSADFADMAGTHLHPKDVPGAIVSLDWADPPDSWRWAGPAWTGSAPARPDGGGLGGLTISIQDPTTTALRWAAVLGLGFEPAGIGGRSAGGADGTDGPDHADREGRAELEGGVIRLDGRGQALRFIGRVSGRPDGISEVRVQRPPSIGTPGDAVEIGGVRFIFVTENHPVEETT